MTSATTSVIEYTHTDTILCDFWKASTFFAGASVAAVAWGARALLVVTSAKILLFLPLSTVKMPLRSTLTARAIVAELRRDQDERARSGQDGWSRSVGGRRRVWRILKALQIPAQVPWGLRRDNE